ncbi:MAG: hypothetical protein IPP56_04075 [Bacteroidetes bacterium]|nr:hypothetical protein [Bacteroidota bacterium]MBK9671256.1 hypothetical protein [Bacteroidota bacterium]MBK9798927.1 hypothetical protein [Bacteroidota bacterium]MBP6413812.1 hypothetical protein [Bacteroidia bacterium]
MKGCIVLFLLRMFYVPMLVFIPLFLGILVLLVGIKDYREDEDLAKKLKQKKLDKEIAKAIVLMLVSLLIWLVVY